jgi:hypothetical protein
MAVRPPVYGLLAEFESPETLVQAAGRVQEAGYRRYDAYSPFPVEGLSEAMGFRRTRMPVVMFFGGLLGCLGALAMQYYCAVISYPLNIGGRPLNSWPSWVPVMFELTVLISALAGVFGLLALCGLPQPFHPLFNVPRFARASRDGFFLCVEARDPKYDKDQTRQLLEGLHPREVTEVPN